MTKAEMLKEKLHGSVAGMRALVIHKERLEKLSFLDFDSLKDVNGTLMQIVLEAYCEGREAALSELSTQLLHIQSGEVCLNDAMSLSSKEVDK